MATYKVFNLVTDEEQYFRSSDMLDCPIKALLAAHFQDIGRCNTLDYPQLFKEYWEKVTVGKHSAGIGDLAVVLPKQCDAGRITEMGRLSASDPYAHTPPTVYATATGRVSGVQLNNSNTPKHA